MVEGRKQAGFPFESREPVRIGDKEWRENLDRDVTLELLVAGAIDLAHAASAQPLGDSIRPQSIARLQQALRQDLTLGGAVALLVFFAFAMQCMSTVAVVRRETGGWRWPIIQFTYMTALAYFCGLAANAFVSQTSYSQAAMSFFNR